MEIRKAGITNVEELRDIGVRTYLDHYTHLWKESGIEWYLERCFGDESLRKDLSDSNIEYYIVSENEENIGILKLVALKGVPDSDIENALYLEKIYFLKEWTGKGVGQKVMEFAFSRARELKREFVWLIAMDTSEKPIAAYERAGFNLHRRSQLDFELLKNEMRGIVILTKRL